MVAIEKLSIDDPHERFTRSGRAHVLMITNHGVHEWKVVPGLPDTGGQNVYVNQFTEALVAQGYRVTIANRGGYHHPVTDRMQTGVIYHPSGHARIIYLEDGLSAFVRKEDMSEQLPELAKDLAHKLSQNGDSYDLIISHYWDAGQLGVMLNGAARKRVPHLWVPHSLGALKKHNMDPSTWAGLRIDERIAHERKLLESVDGCVATSTAIRNTIRKDYGFEARYFLPPCVDETRYRPRSADEVEPVWAFLGEQSDLSVEELKSRKLVTEISRTDKTKRKDILIKAFARLVREVPEALLMVSIDPHAGALHDSLLKLIADQGLQDDVIVLGSVWDQLPLLYNVTEVFCTPSVMEGFGMTSQEAAASGKPVVSSRLVPFVYEYLLGADPERVALNHKGPSKSLLFGQAGVIVPANFVEGFAAALVRLLRDDVLRRRMGEHALNITVPYFTWRHMTENLLVDLGLTAEPKLSDVAVQHAEPHNPLAETLIETWEAQGRAGFLLTDPAKAEMSVREAFDDRCGVSYRFLWMPHREVRSNVPELQRRGILDPHRDESKLFRDPRDTDGRHCFLCPKNVAECHPMETLVPVRLVGRDYFAGANFAWIEPNHFTVMAAEHVDQVYSRHVLEAMLDLHLQTAGRFRVLFNDFGAGATIPWHLHYQITTTPMPIEGLRPGREDYYPAAVFRFPADGDGLKRAHDTAQQWLAGNPQRHRVNILIAPTGGGPCVFVFPRDERYASTLEMGLVGGFEVAGDMVLSSPPEEATFRNASVATARHILNRVRPPDWTSCAGG